MTGIEGDDKGNKRLDLFIIEACANPGRKDDLMADIKALFGEWETDGADAMAVERLAEMIAKAWADPLFKDRLIADPKGVLDETVGDAAGEAKAEGDAADDKSHFCGCYDMLVSNCACGVD
ncbi:MAG TPA: hypothetical protein QF509_03670 [Rhodospirillales bacterium]|jgi:hypothetical protein|nr:hypothetical protein [Rhodospirillales bacterium]